MAREWAAARESAQGLAWNPAWVGSWVGLGLRLGFGFGLWLGIGLNGGGIGSHRELRVCRTGDGDDVDGVLAFGQRLEIRGLERDDCRAFGNLVICGINGGAVNLHALEEQDIRIRAKREAVLGALRPGDRRLVGDDGSLDRGLEVGICVCNTLAVGVNLLRGVGFACCCRLPFAFRELALLAREAELVAKLYTDEGIAVGEDAFSYPDMQLVSKLDVNGDNGRYSQRHAAMRHKI